MGLKVTYDTKVLKGKKVVLINFNHGNEYTLTLENKQPKAGTRSKGTKKGETERVRIPYYMKQCFKKGMSFE